MNEIISTSFNDLNDEWLYYRKIKKMSYLKDIEQRIPQLESLDKDDLSMILKSAPYKEIVRRTEEDDFYSIDTVVSNLADRFADLARFYSHRKDEWQAYLDMFDRYAVMVYAYKDGVCVKQVDYTIHRSELLNPFGDSYVIQHAEYASMNYFADENIEYDEIKAEIIERMID